MPLYRKTGIVEDPWQKLDDDAPVPADGMVLVSFTRWREARAALLARRGPVGVALANTDPVETLASDVSRLDLIVLHFPKFSDGRAYSQARLLRGRLGYQGELRATGGVLQDQVPSCCAAASIPSRATRRALARRWPRRARCSASSISRPRTAARRCRNCG